MEIEVDSAARPHAQGDTAVHAAVTSTSRHRVAGAGEYLSFKVGAEEYALDILKVQEIRSYEPPTRLAGAPASVRGVVNLRGVIVPVIDLRLKLDVGAPRYDEFTVVIVLNVLGRVVGVVVDSVCDVVELQADQIRAAPEFNSSMDADYIRGLAALSLPGVGTDAPRERLLIVADIERLLASAELGLADAAHSLH